MSEHNEQVALFHWAKLTQTQIPELAWLYAIPNGGKRHIRVAQKLKAEGVKPGVWDIDLPIPRGKYNGLKIEMKWGRNKLTENQVKWGKFYRQTGFRTAVCYSWMEAKYVILDYLGVNHDQ